MWLHEVSERGMGGRCQNFVGTLGLLVDCLRTAWECGFELIKRYLDMVAGFQWQHVSVVLHLQHCAYLFVRALSPPQG